MNIRFTFRDETGKMTPQQIKEIEKSLNEKKTLDMLSKEFSKKKGKK